MNKVSKSLDASKWLDEHGDYLFSIAMSRLRNRDAAEEVVQETFLAGIKSATQYSGKGTERAWLSSILKHKIIDVFRRNSRQRTYQPAEDLTDITEMLFDKTGHWKSNPAYTKHRPDQQIQNDEFWEMLNECIAGLPVNQQDAFLLRELEEQSSDEICGQLEITATNLWVILHRARLRLASCINSNWFNKGAS